MTNLQRTATALAALLAAAGAQGAAAQTSFSFSFTAPLTNGDTASGSGTLTTEQEKETYRVTGASGSFILYQGSTNSYTIEGVSGQLFSTDDAYLLQDGDGGFYTNAITFFGMGQYGPGFLGFSYNGDGTYGGGAIEVGIRNGTLSFAPLEGAAVPEPASWALMIAGLGAVGYAMRRRPRLAFA